MASHIGTFIKETGNAIVQHVQDKHGPVDPWVVCIATMMCTAIIMVN